MSKSAKAALKKSPEKSALATRQDLAKGGTRLQQSIPHDAALMPGQPESFRRPLPGVKRVVVVIARHSLSALDSLKEIKHEFS